jgi:hypothetical protein
LPMPPSPTTVTSRTLGSASSTQKLTQHHRSLRLAQDLDGAAAQE